MAQTALVEERTPRQKPKWLTIFLFALTSAFAGYAAWYGIYEGYSFGNWMLFIGLYYFTGLGITVGFHRLATHGGFKCNRVLAIMLYIAGSMAAQKSIRDFIGTHRLHHKYADGPLDPHSPRKKWILSGPFWAHMGWTMFPYEYTKEEFDIMVRDVDRDVVMRVISRLIFVLTLVGFIIPFFLFGWEGLLLSGFLRLFMVDHITFSVNSLTHMKRWYFSKRLVKCFADKRLLAGLFYVLFAPAWLIVEFILLFNSQRKEYGQDPFTDDSQNNLFLNFFGLGEHNHNEHHYDPACPYHGHKWYQLDPSKWFIKALKVKVGSVRFVWDIKSPRKISAYSSIA